MITMSTTNNTHVNITVSWTAPPDPVTGYVIYYQSKEGAVLSEAGENTTEHHSLNGLQKGVTYNISMVALSQHLPSLLVGPVTVSAGEFEKIDHCLSSHNGCYRSTTDGRDCRQL